MGTGDFPARLVAGFAGCRACALPAAVAGGRVRWHVHLVAGRRGTELIRRDAAAEEGDSGEAAAEEQDSVLVKSVPGEREPGAGVELALVTGYRADSIVAQACSDPGGQGGCGLREARHDRVDQGP